MKRTEPAHPGHAVAPTVDSSATCEFCGAPGASVVGGVALCLSCYAERGSCCHEEEPCAPARQPAATRLADITAG